jgi:glycerol-3-phosphate dehydrogenase
VVIGTTEVAVAASEMEPGHAEEEIEYLLETVGPYLEKRVTRSDVRAVFSGLRPLVRGDGRSTSRLSREHAVSVSRNGLISVAGGKWTTYRKMAEDTLDFAIRQGMLGGAACVTETLRLHGAGEGTEAEAGFEREYGSDVEEVRGLIGADAALGAKLDGALPYTLAQVVYAVRAEMARTVEDVLSRRTRALLLDAEAAVRAAPVVAAAMARELGRDAAWAEEQVRRFTALARMFYTAA